MTINQLIRQRNLTKYRLSKESGVPYATISDICSGKTQPQKCTAETIFKLAKTLQVPMESIIEPCFANRSSFELFKSHICHKVKRLGDVNFIIEALEQDAVGQYYNKKCYPEALYLLAMLDYISRINGVPLCTKYDDLRRCQLTEMIYPTSVHLAALVAKSNKIMNEALEEAIPEFLRHNIVESEVRNVV